MEKLPKQFELRKTKFEPRPRCVCGDIKINHERDNGKCEICQCTAYDEIGILTVRQYEELKEKNTQ